ncbi:hypothetical protein HELRODRAFT_89456 [Helobdella robusta]|uniref:2-methoxy-6-polyprenyl-1,4-benzoquinol methylase, mitochondrial n=1 Tax=Helobdella robusta TaxID=6412 RepID=T1G7D1_HELRO|nr:hypothetical protein HELRODRAFT_89456 [Helobdella robusta]ESN92463.1 hypothetical protein HELRODRAFT_89456 [Helobdella robusta]
MFLARFSKSLLICKPNNSPKCRNLIDQFRYFSTNTNQTHFGFETVSEKEKEERVYQVFHNVADKYDLMNDVMSAGIHRLWKDCFIKSVGPISDTNLLDVAGGTGDISFRYLQYLKNSSKSATVTVLDINQAMLNVGRDKAKSKGFQNEITWVQGNAENLPFSENQFDVYTVAYGIRNMTHIDKVLKEAYRVLKPGGRFACLEFSRVDNFFLRNLYDNYSFHIIPVMGKLIAGDYKSYKYLVESIRQFPDQETFSEMIEEAGFSNVNHENLMFGVSAIHSGFKI